MIEQQARYYALSAHQLLVSCVLLGGYVTCVLQSEYRIGATTGNLGLFISMSAWAV